MSLSYEQWRELRTAQRELRLTAVHGRGVQLRRFELHRDTDVSGVSGTGLIAEGVEWSDGTATVRWLGDWPTTQDHDRGVAAIEHVHGHGGATRIVWLD